jgi:hypothetical protein
MDSARLRGAGPFFSLTFLNSYVILGT